MVVVCGVLCDVLFWCYVLRFVRWLLCVACWLFCVMRCVLCVACCLSFFGRCLFCSLCRFGRCVSLVAFCAWCVVCCSFVVCSLLVGVCVVVLFDLGRLRFFCLRVVYFCCALYRAYCSMFGGC